MGAGGLQESAVLDASVALKAAYGRELVAQNALGRPRLANGDGAVERVSAQRRAPMQKFRNWMIGDRMNGRGRRGLLLTLAVVVVGGGVGVGWISTRSPHGDPDPGGRILAGLKSIESVVPADAEVMSRQASEPSWDSCDGRAGTFGWNKVVVNVQFRTGEQPGALVARTDRLLTVAGWHRTEAGGTPLGPRVRWSRTVAGSTVASALLSPGTRGGGSGTYWDLDAAAPPQGGQVSGC
jgi:hypothetical protein